ncbi:MAG: prepilin-type N-terminal cleavage/methylation domain-containing protein [Candidatus Kerfeldbacteria bacterium]|nr:prepilin-type N-terminal cleavage/methylation domain-containing protein [Candidatus Kerfeldbacteria bacterium]
MKLQLLSRKRSERGVSVVEVLIALSIAGIVFASIGNLVLAVQRIDHSSGLREQALAYAKQSLEVVNDIKDTAFTCRCSTGDCTTTPGHCQKTSGDTQTCPLLSGYTSCWTQFTNGVGSNSPLHVQNSGGSWKLVAGQDTSDPTFTRELSITNQGGDSNVKQVLGTVSWNERGVAKSVALTLILTGWKNLP